MRSFNDYEYDFTNLHLPGKEYYILKFSQFGKHKYSGRYDNLIRIGMMKYAEFKTDEIGQQIPLKTKCKITEKGLCYLRYCNNHFVNNRLPVIISLIALAVSLFGT